MLGFYIPTVFAPIADGHNDVYKPMLFGNVKQYRFAIYDRWGTIVSNLRTPEEGGMERSPEQYAETPSLFGLVLISSKEWRSKPKKERWHWWSRHATYVTNAHLTAIYSPPLTFCCKHRDNIITLHFVHGLNHQHVQMCPQLARSSCRLYFV